MEDAGIEAAGRGYMQLPRQTIHRLFTRRQHQPQFLPHGDDVHNFLAAESDAGRERPGSLAGVAASGCLQGG